MKDADYRKALLLTRIDAHRTILRLEIRCARSSFNPWNAALGLLGGSGSGHLVTRLVPLLLGVLLPLLRGRSRPEEDRG